MSYKDELEIMTKAIVMAHGGQAWFNYEESTVIVGCGRHTLANKLDSVGAKIQKLGPSKRVSAYTLVLVMMEDSISPLDNTTKAAYIRAKEERSLSGGRQRKTG